jgi:UDP-N-acetylglucosamine--N-acetylmuramyl-(pentapeptide) pyrophosphoryl-undecaprenol N-acetylglucosamine transferase
MEMQKIQAGFKLGVCGLLGLQRKISLQNLMFPFKLADSLWKAKKIIKEFNPDVVIGTGGFASGPL